MAKKTTSIILFAGVFLALILFRATSVLAEVDQEQIRCDECTEAFAYSIKYMAPVGQEFTPTLSGIDALELLVRDFDSYDGLGATLQVNIRGDTITGPVIGVSIPVYVPNSEYFYPEVVRFDFGTTVALAPGKTYVIEIVHLDGGNFGVCGCTDREEDPYPNGRVITKYGPGDWWSDLWFREGMAPLGEAPPGPYIESIEPSSGAPGIHVTIRGKNFNAPCVLEWVNFGSQEAYEISWKDDEIVVTVPYPYGQETVEVTVEKMLPQQKSNSVLFTYKKPYIDSISPSSGKPKTEVAIQGHDFGLWHIAAPDFYIKFGKSFASPSISWTDTEIMVKAPSDYGTGENDRKILMWLIKLVVTGGTYDLPDLIWDIVEELITSGVRIKPSEGVIQLDVTVATPAGKSNAELFTYTVDSIIKAHLRSAGELRVQDSYGNVTGSINGIIKEEIPYSYCDGDTVLIVDPDDSYFYEVVGIDDGTYGLVISSVARTDTYTFQASGIPTSACAIHEYYIDWDALSSGQQGVVLRVDADGDGIFEKTIIADSDLTSDEFILQTETVVDFAPDTLNLKSKGKWVTVYIELPVGHGYGVSMIELASITLNDQVQVEAKPIEIGDYDSDGIPDLMVKFDRAQVSEILKAGEQTITLAGCLADGRLFAGTHVIRVIH